MKTVRFWMLWAGLLCLTLNTSVVANDVVTLNSGEVIAGRITSENDTQLVIEVSNLSRTIFSTRTVSKSEIKNNQRETPEAKQERLAYEAVLRYRLNPDQEFTTAQYDDGVAACQKYLETYPASAYAAVVRQLGVQLQKEKEQVESGLVKFDNRWMSASQKASEQSLRASQKAPPASPRTHVVQKGETWQSIALQYYGTRSAWEKIYAANRSVLSNKDQLKVGQQLVIPGVFTPPAKKEEQAKKAEQPSQQFYGIFEAFDAHSITIKNRGRNETKTFTITSESRIVNHPVTELPSYSKQGIELIEFPNHITKGSIVWAAYREEGQTLTLINFAGGSVVVGADGSNDGEGAERKTDFNVEYIVKGGLFSKGCLVVSMGGRVVALENHPKQDSLAEGDSFSCHVRREGTFEGTDSKGQFRRLPRWVYVSER